MTVSLDALFDTISTPVLEDATKRLFAVLPVPGYESYLVGKDSDSCACLLITTADSSQRQPAPLRLESVDVQFELPCNLRKEHEPERTGRFTVLRCLSIDRETVRYFLSICRAILGLLGDSPPRHEVASAVKRLVAIFQSATKPPTRSINGLFGELYFIRRSHNPVRTLAAWRIDDTSRFDFVDGDVRLEVKTASGRNRTHVFSYEQCNPPPGTVAAAVSMFVERVSTGLSLRVLLDEIEELVAARPDLVLKLHEVTTATLGSHFNEALSLAFDNRLAQASLRLFDVADVPAIRGALPAGVSDLHFRSDLSSSKPIPAQELAARKPSISGLLPR